MSINTYLPIVVGESHYNTLGLIRSFGEGGYEPILILIIHTERDKKSFITKSKYINKYYYSTEEKLIDDLNKINLSGSKGVIFPSGDSIANIIDESRNRLSTKFLTPLFNKRGGYFAVANDKERMRLRAENFGFKTPKTWIITKDTQINNLDIEFP